jgi:hypothetical protein
MRMTSDTGHEDLFLFCVICPAAAGTGAAGSVDRYSV